jgi:hypothetical protein
MLLCDDLHDEANDLGMGLAELSEHTGVASGGEELSGEGREVGGACVASHGEDGGVPVNGGEVRLMDDDDSLGSHGVLAFWNLL